MKISNLRVTKFIAYSQLILVCALLIVILYINKLLPIAVLSLFVVLTIYALINTKTVTFECSGGCVTVRKAHPFTYKKFISPEFELPYTHVQHTMITKNLCATKVRLNIKSNKDKKYSVKVTLLGLSQTEKKKLSDALKLIENKNLA